MEKTNIEIRVAAEADAEALLKIYTPYVKHTAITFEYEVPTVEEFASRIKKVLQRYPYFIAEADGKAVGYAYVSPFKERAAYDWAVETSIYVDRNKRGMGIGKKLYEALECTLKEQNICNLNACIGYPEVEDEYLTKDSVKFHEHLGYSMVGEFHKCGYKFNRWYNMVWMEKMIGEHEKDQKAIKLFDEVRENVKS